jgi:hypothetical protein
MKNLSYNNSVFNMQCAIFENNMHYLYVQRNKFQSVVEDLQLSEHIRLIWTLHLYLNMWKLNKKKQLGCGFFVLVKATWVLLKYSLWAWIHFEFVASVRVLFDLDIQCKYDWLKNKTLKISMQVLIEYVALH